MNETAKNLLTVLDKALAKTAPSPHPLTDEFFAVLHDERPRQKIFPTEFNKRPTIHNEQTFVKWMQLQPMSEEDRAAWPDLRKQSLDKFHFELPESPDGFFRLPMDALATSDEVKVLREVQIKMEATAEAMQPFSLDKVSDRMTPSFRLGCCSAFTSATAAVFQER